ncbi:eukaryotic translation initiation factor 4E type 2-like isoform X4 [Eriocheir sinensis]|uniref:eukaryotic translation initiation factor 4E type 2-like isoform X4 n=1 Tax=Eriocheir sinensis TaxID=95602 RepID=UPI0021C8BFF0|nr:eukaryotic translation initiation factor 4E type 2-like isoform X4 [Eriocheir sinensis]
MTGETLMERRKKRKKLKNNDDSGEEDNGSRDLKEMDKPLPPVEVKPGDHRLQFTYSIWFSRRAPGKQATTQNYDQNLKLIGRFASVEQFWGYYSRLVRPADLNSHSDIHIFKDGIKPMWEDGANKNGGKWIVRLRKGLASRCWENMILAMLGEQFMVGDEICGAVISVRFQEDIISVWNRTAQDTATTTRIRDTLKRVLNLPPNTVMEYKTHNDSLKDRFSFRNTRAADGFAHRADTFLR